MADNIFSRIYREITGKKTNIEESKEHVPDVSKAYVTNDPNGSKHLNIPVSVQDYIPSIRKDEKANDQVLKKPKISKMITTKGLVNRWNERPYSRDLGLVPSYDFEYFLTLWEKEGLFKRAVDKIVELIMKDGYALTGKNVKTVSYVEKRLAEFAKRTNPRKPFKEILRELAFHTVLLGNAYLYTKRNKDQSSGRVWTREDGKEMDPIAGLFVENPANMRIVVDRHGSIKRYVQDLDFADDNAGYFSSINRFFRGIFNRTGTRTFAGDIDDYPSWKPEEIVHIYTSKRPGDMFGIPLGNPVIDDIKTLRALEESVELLAYQYGHPIMQVQIGDKDIHPEPPDIELQRARDAVDQMEGNGSMVTPWFYNVRLIWPEGSTIDLVNFMEWFLFRIFSSLGHSGVSMGQTGTANRGTAVTLDKSLQDLVTHFQSLVSEKINEYLFDELLYESGIKEINDENRVQLFFKTVDIDKKTAIENAAAQLFMSNGITLNEFRQEVGKPPVKGNDGDKFLRELNSDLENTRIEKQLSHDLQKQRMVAQNKSAPENQSGRKGSKSPPVNQKWSEDSLNPLQENKMETVKMLSLNIDNDKITKVVEDAVKHASTAKCGSKKNARLRSYFNSFEEGFHTMFEEDFGRDTDEYVLRADYLDDYKECLKSLNIADNEIKEASEAIIDTLIAALPDADKFVVEDQFDEDEDW